MRGPLRIDEISRKKVEVPDRRGALQISGHFPHKIPV
jgi:hypothetical protein